MRKLSQRELLDEGFGSMLSGLARGARNAIGSVATAMAPETMGALSKGASIASGAVERIRSGSPRASAGTFFDSEDGKREFKDIKLGKETKLPNQNFKIEVKSGYYLNSVGGDQIEEKDLSGGYVVLRRKKRGGAGGFDNEIIEVWDSNNKRLNEKPIKAGTDIPTATTGQDGKPEADGKPEEGKGEGTASPRDGRDGRDGRDATSNAPPEPEPKPEPKPEPEPESEPEPETEPEPSKPKFFASLKQWKIDNIGPEAGTVSITGIQLKEFLKTLKVEDPDRVLKQADIKVNGAIPKNTKLGTLESIIKSRGLVAESIRSQKNILRRLNIERYK